MVRMDLGCSGSPAGSRTDGCRASGVTTSALRARQGAMRRSIRPPARPAGDPGEIERAINVMGLDGDPGGWAEQLARIASELRFSTLLVGVGGEDPVGLVLVRRLGEDVAPRVRQLLE